MERENAWRYFEIHKWPTIRQLALKFVMAEAQKKNEFWDFKLIQKVCARFKIGTAFGFYQHRPDLYWS